MYTRAALEENSEDVLDAQSPAGISLIAVECYQSLKQMAFQLRGLSPRRGDLSKIMCIKDDDIILFTNHFCKEKSNGTHL